MNRELFAQPADGYNQMLIPGQAKCEVLIEMGDLHQSHKVPSWVELYDDTSMKIKELQEKSKKRGIRRIVNELKKMQQLRIKPKFNSEEDKVLDKKIAAYTKDIYNVFFFIYLRPYVSAKTT